MKSWTLGTIAVPQLELRLMIFWQSQAFGYGLLGYPNLEQLIIFDREGLEHGHVGVSQ